MDYTNLLDWVADQLALAVPGNVLQAASDPGWYPDSQVLQAKHAEFRALSWETREHIVREWFAATEPAEPKFTPWQGPWPTDGY